MQNGRFKAVDLGQIKTYSVAKREHKVSQGRMATTPPAGASVREWLDSLPDFLGAAELKRVVAAVVAAVRADRPIVAAMGAHVVKVGCSPIIIDLMQRGVISALAVNGATAIHDVELATQGETSEDVGDTIRDGRFGMVTETLSFFSDACELADKQQLGWGHAVGRLLLERGGPCVDQSLLAAACRRGIPVTVHVALGTDTIHMAKGVDGARLGAASMRDFELLCGIVSQLGASEENGPGGVWLNIGSAVILPEVFLKAVSVARNLGANLDSMVTANFDMQRHYRPKVNVVTRPVSSGNGHEVVGQHEILLPLLRQAIVEDLG